MKSISLTLLLLGISSSLLAQYSIRGRIADAHDSSVPFANVLLLNSSDSVLVKGSVADQDGNFLLSEITGVIMLYKATW